MYVGRLPISFDLLIDGMIHEYVLIDDIYLSYVLIDGISTDMS